MFRKYAFIKWKLEKKNVYYYEEYFNNESYPDGVTFYLDYMYDSQSGDHIRCNSIAFEVDGVDYVRYSDKGVANILLDNTPFSFSGKCSLDVSNYKEISFTNFDFSMVRIRFYSEKFFDDAYNNVFNITGKDSPEEILPRSYSILIKQDNGVWIYDENGDAPFNNGQDISIPIKIRTPNPYRANEFYCDEETYNPEFKLMIGSDPDNMDFRGNMTYAPWPYPNNIVALGYGKLKSLPIRYSGELIPKGDIYISLFPVIPFDAFIHFLTIRVWIW